MPALVISSPADSSQGASDLSTPINGDGASVTSQRKRARHEILSDEEDNVSESGPDDDVVDDGTSALRTRIQRRSTGKSSRTSNETVHQPGSIVRILVKNFVTYTSASFYPGPALNMVIGPNGTGKSTLVCAICLGLGWGTVHLGRAKDLGEFVKHGCAKAIIEIELKGKLGETNPVIRRQIVRDGNKSTFQLNDQTVPLKRVLDLMRSFNIQIDNLCQFLPQDRVVEFAQLDPKDLLISTQRAAAPPYLLEWHNELKQLRMEQKHDEGRQEELKTTLCALEARQNLQRADVERMRERKELSRKIELMSGARPFAEYAQVKKEFDEKTKNKRDGQEKLEALKRQVAPSLSAMRAKEDYKKRVAEAVNSKRGVLMKLEADGNQRAKKRNDAQKAVEECDREVGAELDVHKTRNNDIARIRGTIVNIEKRMEEEPVEFDATAYNEQLRAKDREVRAVEQSVKDTKDEIRANDPEIGDREQKVTEAQRALENLRSQAGQQDNKLKSLSRDTASAWAWIQEHRDQFQNTVYGPPVLECSIRDKRYADSIESLMQMNHFTAITCTNQVDFQLLNRQVFKTMNLHDVSLRTVTRKPDQYPPPISDEEMRHLGIDGWAIDFLTGPDAVLAMLCEEARLHRAGICLRDTSDAQYTDLERSEVDTWATTKSVFRITRRKEYGAGAVSTSVRDVRKAQVWTSRPVDTVAENDTRDNIAGWKSEIVEFEKRRELLKMKLRDLQRQSAELRAEATSIEEEKSAKQKANGEYKALPNKLATQKTKLADFQRSEKQTQETILAIRKRQVALVLQRGQLTLDHAKFLGNAREKLLGLTYANIVLIEAQSDYEILVDRNRSVMESLQDMESMVKDLIKEHAEYRSNAQKLGQEVVALRSSRPDIVEYWTNLTEKEQTQKPEDIDNEIESLQSRLESLHEGNPRAIVEYEDRAVKIAATQTRLQTLEVTLAASATSIAEVRAKWEPELDALMSRVSDAFAASFAKIHCAGAVAVHKAGDDGGDFDAWQAQVQVRFREGEQMSVLDSHRQSGGERAVSTIFYLMALQGLSRAPFRVVDEINQGMDPRNERVVHERMVDVACGRDGAGDGGGSQYFLITPKLLSGLKYSPGMKVHCIASGEFMPTDWRDLDFKALLAKAREGGKLVAAAA